jgi:two-component system cell cycle sensor histidine kinase/response regulator CckA
MANTDAQSLRVLILDDHEADAELVLRELRRCGFAPDWTRVQTESDYLEALSSRPDVILADYSMPSFTATRALEIRNSRGLDIPFIVISGSIDDETAVEILKKGAADYLLKDRLARAGSAVQRALDERVQRLATEAMTRQLQESETRTRFALEASRVGVWEADLDTGAATWSEMLEALHGLAPGTFGGTLAAFLEHIHADDRAQVAEAIERATREHTDSNILYRTTWPDGSVHWISGMGRTFYDADGRARRAAGIGLDVTERRTLEEQYRQAHKMEAVGQLAGGVAHDFNNLLTVIGGFGAIIAEEAGPEHPFSPHIQQIQKAAHRATSLTRQLLAFGRRQILEVSVFDLREAILEMESMLRRLIGEHIAVRIKTSVEDCRVRADRTQIEQVVMNLAINARDAMPSGGTLSFEVSRAELDHSYGRHHPGARAGRYVLMAVSDSGSGMSAETKARIFEPFFTTKARGKGTGLGLSTVYGIVKQSSGNIYVYSEPGHGTTFKIYLPLEENQVDGTVDTPAAEVIVGSETILVVEDDESVRDFIHSVLTGKGFRVLVASQPAIALATAAAEQGPIDLLLSDVVLPEMSGKVLAAKLVQRRPDLRVLYMSGYTDDAIVSQGVLHQGTQFLSKPFAPDTLLRKVREALSTRRGIDRGVSTPLSTPP